MSTLAVELPLGGRLVVAANLRLGRAETAATEAAVNELVEVLDGWDGAGVFVIAGGFLDDTDEKATHAAARNAYPRLFGALDSFSREEGRQLLILPQDAELLDVAIRTGAGMRHVHICAGDARDPSAALRAGADGVIDGACAPRLTNLGSAFVASAGRVGELTEERLSHFGLFTVKAPTRVASWVELEAGADLHARLWFAQVDVPGASMWSRVVARREERPDRPTRVATFPGDESWPAPTADLDKPNRMRRRAAALIALAGVLNVVSALTPPLEQRLSGLTDLVPLAVPQTATALVTLSGLGLLALARGIRRGQQRSFRVALGLLIGSFVLHLVKGIDVEEASAAGVVAVYLFAHRGSFQTRGRARAIRHGVRALVGAFVGTVATCVAAIEVITAADGHRVTLPRAFLATVERMVDVHSVALPHRLDDFASPVLLSIAIGFLAWIAWQAIQPAAARRGTRDELGRARQIVNEFGAGTLDYFALREDKEYFFTGQSLVAYAVHQGVCLVSPDPIGPAWERAEAWDAFRRFADEHSWAVGLLGADEEWLPIYRRSGMHDLYVGDEAVVDVTRFSLEGGRNKGLRQARNRVANHGYTMTFHDPAGADDALKDSVQAVMGLSRRGDVERGFSMTLGRIFNPDDRGLLLAVCRDAAGTPVAFCQYVPAPGINGYSLDLMRRDNHEHPNGLLEFVLVETILFMAANGYRKLGLNFATMRAVLAGETGAGIATRVERWAVKRMSGSMQIESLWKFNAKFDPEWQPRYAVYDAVGNIVPIAFAIARAESWWELPVLGRFLMPPAPSERAERS